ncbi:MAG: photosystem I assembly protein Ycf4 [Leptolyngbya sp. RL_3_1]|nr:photosystem I assembly protein Ycf4 [Leptolyngbya sp. RL_3_1]
MTVSSDAPSATILKHSILGARRLSNYWWAAVVTLGATGFLLASLSSYFHKNLLPFVDSSQFVFIPQGVAMGFYGVAGLLLATYLWLIIFWDIGGGYNEFDQATQQIRIMRSGFPGENRRILIEHGFDQVLAVRVDIREGLNPKRALYLRLKGRPELPLTRVGQPLPLAFLENQGAELARFLQVPLEGL